MTDFHMHIETPITYYLFGLGCVSTLLPMSIGLICAINLDFYAQVHFHN